MGLVGFNCETCLPLLVFLRIGMRRLVLLPGSRSRSRLGRRVRLRTIVSVPLVLGRGVVLRLAVVRLRFVLRIRTSPVVVKRTLLSLVNVVGHAAVRYRRHRPGHRDVVRASVIAVEVRIVVAHGRVHVLRLERSPSLVLFVHGRTLLRAGIVANSARSAAVRNSAVPGDRIPVRISPVFVHTMNASFIDMHIGSVVFKVVTVPSAADEIGRTHV